MPDFIERTIYKLSLDADEYIRGVDRAVASTQKLTIEQDRLNLQLQAQNEALASITDALVKARTDLTNYSGTDETVKRQLQRNVSDLETAQKKALAIVDQSRVAYERAKKAAEEFSAAQGKVQPLQPLRPVGPATGQLPIIPAAGSAGATLAAITSQINELTDADFKDFINQVDDGFQSFRSVVEEANEELENMIGTEKDFSEEFKNLAIIVKEGNEIVRQFDEITGEAGRSALSYRQQVRLLKEDLEKLRAEGKEGTKQFTETEQKLVDVQRAMADAAQRARILRSETKVIDFGRAAITTATSAFQAYTSAAILAGGASEELQKKTFQLFAAMQLLTSIEQLNNALKRNSTILTLGQSAATAVYTAVVGRATGALRLFRVALLGTAVGAAVGGLAILLIRFLAIRKATEDARKEQKLYNDVITEAANASAAEIAKLEVFRAKLNDVSISQKDRVAVAKEYNKIADEQNQIDITQIDNLTKINGQIEKQIVLIRQRALATAALTKLTEQSNKVIEAELRIGLLSEKSGKDIENLAVEAAELRSQIDEITKGRKPEGANQAIELTNEEAAAYNKLIQQKAAYLNLTQNEIIDLLKLTFSRNEANKELDKMTQQLQKFLTIPGITTKPPPTKAIENVFEEERRALNQRLEQLRIDELRGEERILAEGAARLQREQERIEKLRKEKKVTAPQAQILLAEVDRQNTIEVERSLEAFHKSVIEREKALQDELRKLRQENRQQELALIEDEFERRAAAIEVGEQNEIAVRRAGLEERLAELERENEQQLLFFPYHDKLEAERQYQLARNQIITDSEIDITNIVRKYSIERQKLSADLFKKSLEQFQKAIQQNDLAIDEQLTETTRILTQNFIDGIITYELYQQRLTAIQKRYSDQRRDQTIRELERELFEVQKRLQGLTAIPETERKELEAIRDSIRKQLAQLKRERELAKAEGLKPDTEDDNEELQKFLEYTDAIGNLTQSIIEFWARANEAEQQALERSIRIQEQRVEAARRIAERGNAQYLKMEEDKLKELQIARENAARRELAINAAIQASQLLVGITGAIAKIASGLGPAETIASIAVIVGALATGFGLVRSLQNNQPTFAEGTTYVKRGNRPKGKDTIPAWLDEGEAVIPQKKNKKYKQTVEAIYHGKVPADILNEFVENYITNKTNKTVTATTNKYESFVENIKKVPTKVLNTFIENYHRRQTNFEEKKYFKGTPELKGEKGVDRIPIFASDGEAIIPAEKNRLFKPVINALFENKIPAEHLNNFVNNYNAPSSLNKMIERYHNNKTEVNNFINRVEKYHHIKSVPQVNYEKIKEASEIHIGADGKLAYLMTEQNRKIDENNYLQRRTLEAMKNMAISATIDRDGIAIAVNEYMKQLEIDKNT